MCKGIIFDSFLLSFILIHSALHFIIGCNFQTHHCTLYEKSELASLSMQRSFNWYCFIYKSICGLTPSYLSLSLSNTNVQYNNLRSDDLLYVFTPVNWLMIVLCNLLQPGHSWKRDFNLNKFFFFLTRLNKGMNEQNKCTDFFQWKCISERSGALQCFIIMLLLSLKWHIRCHLCMFKLIKLWTLRNEPNINQGKKTTTLSTKSNARGALGTWAECKVF